MDVDTYIDTFDKEVRERLTQMRKLVRQEAPDAVESFTYALLGTS